MVISLYRMVRKYIFNDISMFPLNGLVGNTFLSALPDTGVAALQWKFPFHLFLPGYPHNFSSPQIAYFRW